jgi:hypothetical protein
MRPSSDERWLLRGVGVDSDLDDGQVGTASFVVVVSKKMKKMVGCKEGTRLLTPG